MHIWDDKNNFYFKHKLIVSVSSDDNFLPPLKRNKKGSSTVTEKAEKYKTQTDPLPKRNTRHKAVNVDTGEQ